MIIIQHGISSTTTVFSVKLPARYEQHIELMAEILNNREWSKCVVSINTSFADFAVSVHLLINYYTNATHVRVQ